MCINTKTYGLVIAKNGENNLKFFPFSWSIGENVDARGDVCRRLESYAKVSLASSFNVRAYMFFFFNRIELRLYN